MKWGIIDFGSPEIWFLGLPLALLAGVLGIRAQMRLGVARRRIAVLGGIRAFVFLAVTFLLSKPNWVSQDSIPRARRPVALLIDRSESMSFEDGNGTRFQQAIEFIRKHLGPALNEAGIPLRYVQFAESAEIIEAQKLGTTTPSGKRTNLAGAIAQALSAGDGPPLAIIACSDGGVNETADNTRALSALVESHVPFVGVGFGNDQGVRTLSLVQVEAPEITPPNTEFSVSAHMEMLNAETVTSFDLVLYRDGKMVQKKSVAPGSNSRLWLESFQVSEKEEGTHSYSIQLLPPGIQGLKSVSTAGTAAVRIRAEKELRVLFVQGSLTWDYKFIGLALKSDPSIKVTGLTRTSTNQVFRQNVENAGELAQGFPKSIEEISPFRVIVLSNLKPIDLAPTQQELLSRFCSELGGGLLILGGSQTFDSSWQKTTLEKVLPITIANDQGVRGLDRPFRFQVTEEALRQPAFQITEDMTARQAWGKLPVFTQYARVDSAKPGAQVWASHPADSGPHGPRILLASQRYGAGLTSVLCVENFWRWRLAKDAEPGQFDRFWRQFFRFLAEARRQEVSIYLADQELRPGTDIRVTLEKPPTPRGANEPAFKILAQVENDEKKILTEERVELRPRQPVNFTFRADKPGLYSVAVRDQTGQPVAARTIEVRDLNVEYQNAARNMETLRQWASLSDGLAIKVEDCNNPAELVSRIKSKVEQFRQNRRTRTPMGINGWSLAALLASLSSEWLLRKRWGLI